MKWALAFATARVFDKKHKFLEVPNTIDNLPLKMV